MTDRTNTETAQGRDAALDAIALISQGIQALRVATEGDPALRARMHTRALRELVGAGPRDSDAANWVQVLRGEREHAMRAWLATGAETADVAAACWMTPKRVSQIVGGGGYRSTGRPNGRPIGSGRHTKAEEANAAA